MVRIGKMNTLRVARKSALGVYLDGGELGEVLLPPRDVPAHCEVGDSMEVFVYVDSDGTLVATTERPFATVGEFAYLKVLSVTDYGAFVDWGLRKNLLVPFSEQNGQMVEGRSYVVHIYLDKRSGRCVASAKLDKFLDLEPVDYAQHQQVDLLICERTDIGRKVIVNHRHWGVLHEADIFQPLRYGQRMVGYIKKVREDRKIDVVLSKPGYSKVEPVAADVLAKLKASPDGFIAVSDKSPPEQIYALFGVSKKTFKQAVSALYRERLITIESSGLRLNR